AGPSRTLARADLLPQRAQLGHRFKNDFLRAGSAALRRASVSRALAPSADVLAQEFERALAGEFGGGGIPRCTLVTVETVVGGVDEDLRFRMHLGEFPDAGHRDPCVAFAKVCHHRTSRAFGRRIEHAAPVIRYGAGKAVQSTRAHPGNEATPAVADDGYFPARRNGIACRRDVAQRNLGCRPRLELASPRNIGGRVADVDATLVAIEERRCNHAIAVSS